MNNQAPAPTGQARRVREMFGTDVPAAALLHKGFLTCVLDEPHVLAPRDARIRI